MTDVEMVPAAINGRWPLLLPSYRAARPEAPWWEAARLASMHHFLAGAASDRHRPLRDDEISRPMGRNVIFDIGAEEGDFPALWSTWGLDVVLVEPNPKVWPNIRAIWEANELQPALGWFVGFASDEIADSEAGADFDAAERDGWPACAYGDLVGDHGFRHLAQQTDVTPQTTIDELAGRLVWPDAITIDVEGAELRVLKGAEYVLRHIRPKVWVSVHPDAMKVLYDTPSGELIAYMHDLDYEPTFLASDHEEHWMFLPRG